MRKIVVLLFLILVSCQSSKKIVDTKTDFNTINIEFKSSQSKMNLNGFSYFHSDSNILNIYGPLGINVLKIVSKFDSLWIVDIVNKKVYFSKYIHISEIIYNFFHGKFSTNEQQLLCSLGSLFITGLNCREGYDGVPFFNYKTFNKGKSIFVNCSFQYAGGLYSIKVKLANRNNNNLMSTRLTKYTKFENIYLNVK